MTGVARSWRANPGPEEPCRGEHAMPKVRAGNVTLNYDQQGSGEPLILIPYLAADHACYAFQVAEYAKHFTCISIDPPPPSGMRRTAIR